MCALFDRRGAIRVRRTLRPHSRHRTCFLSDRSADDTLEAARIAGLELLGGDLLDEPVAAFLDYVLTNDIEEFDPSAGPRNLLVFDLVVAPATWPFFG